MANLYFKGFFGKVRLQIGIIWLTGVFMVSKLNNIRKKPIYGFCCPLKT